MAEEQKREFKGIWIPKEIWLNKELIMMEKILLAEIDSFENKERGCWASNQYLADILNISPSRISQIVSKLSKLKYVTVELKYRPHSKEVDRRIIRTNKRKIYDI